ncbi:MAG: type II toxin-antitoxin system RelE/ParE family toxin [Bacteroidales bacterium]|nr:type II toxin-antitoxin system RelE/ParE family toxin [Bacteroidales bacterium]
MKIIWSEQAMEAVADTAGYILDNFGKNASQKFIRKIKKAATLLLCNPHTGKIESGLDDVAATYRGLLVTKINKLIYRLDEDGNIYVSVFWDCRRDPETLSNFIS